MAEETIIEKKGVNFLGIEHIDKDGKVHWELFVIRGNGNLKLTGKGLYFSQWLPEKELFIPVESILKVEIGNSHNGKWSLFKVLRVFYKDEEGVKVFGVCIGRKKTSLEWKNKIESLLRLPDIPA